MKRTLLDITQQISRKPGNVILKPKDLQHPDYWVFEAKGWKFVDLLREIEYRETQDRLRIYLNTQNISANDYIVEVGPDGLIFKFIKSRFELYTQNGFNLDEKDFIEVKGDIEKYA